MHRLRGEPFLKGIEQAATFHQFLAAIADDSGTVVEKSSLKRLVLQLQDLEREVLAVGLAATAAPLQRAISILKAAPNGPTVNGIDRSSLSSADVHTVQNYLSQFTSRIPDDFQSMVVLILGQKRAQLFSASAAFGQDVFDKFPSASEDISEAATCLALDRGTSCVMHLQRALEAPLRAFSVSLGVAQQDNWGAIIRLINTDLDRRARLSNSQSTGQEFFFEAAAEYKHIQRAWRNPTMHLEKSYSPDRAEEIFVAVKSFMRHLATRLSE